MNIQTIVVTLSVFAFSSFHSQKIFKAISDEDIEKVSKLLEKEDVNQLSKEYQITPLYAAAGTGNMKLVELLIYKRSRYQ